MTRPTRNIPWDITQLSEVPAWKVLPDFTEPGVTAIMYEGLPWQGKPTRVFAWFGLPERWGDEPVPGMVLVHGGGGTAFADWVRLWTARGYAAIAMDTCGCVPVGEYANWQRHEAGGPAGWGGFAQIDEPLEEQWPYHAIAAVLLGHSLLRAHPGVDPERIGITGISWGGYLTNIAAGIDARFRAAVPVYGCGFLGEDSTWLPTFAEMGEERAARWLSLWDPAAYLPAAIMPMLWVTGTNDFAYPMGSLQKSYRLPATPPTLCIRVNMPHGHHGPGENPEEIRAFADSIMGNGIPLPRITGQGVADGRHWVTYTSPTPIVRAEFNYTRDATCWQERVWHITDAELTARDASAAIPPAATACYLNLIEERGLVVSSEHCCANTEPST
jgi:dienelactone hydrolase